MPASSTQRSRTEATEDRRRAAELPRRPGDAVTGVDEAIVSGCRSCGARLEQVIPAGTPESIAGVMRGLRMLCTPCSDREDAEERERERGRIRHQHEQTCELPRELRGLCWEDYDTGREGAAAAKAAAMRWSRGEHERRGLLLTGPHGVGKTRLAATALWAALGDFKRTRRGTHVDGEAELVPGIAVRYVNVADLIVRMSASFGDKDRAAALRVLTGRGAVVLDDVDKIHVTMTVLAHLYTAIDGRIQAGSPLIVTTNLTPGQLREKLRKPGRNEDAEERAVAADAIMSRLTGYCTLHGIRGADGRQT